MIASTRWLLGAACARDGLRDLPWTDEHTTTLDRANMARVCASCPVLAACTIATVTTETTAGFWAGHDRTRWRDITPAVLVDDRLAGLPVQDTLPGLELVATA